MLPLSNSNSAKKFKISPQLKNKTIFADIKGPISYNEMLDGLRKYSYNYIVNMKKNGGNLENPPSPSQQEVGVNYLREMHHNKKKELMGIIENITSKRPLQSHSNLVHA